MSYRPAGSYRLPSHEQSNQDQSSQEQQQQQQQQQQQLQQLHAQNGQYLTQYQQAPYPSQPQQHIYNGYHEGGPVQQPQLGYQDAQWAPRGNMVAATYPGQQQYQQPAAYNPQHYAPPPPPPSQRQPMQTYNAHAYLAMNAPQISPSYNPAAYAGVSSHGTSGPVDPLAYSPQQPQYAQSPFPTQSSFDQQQQPQYTQLARQYSYTQPRSPHIQSSYQPATHIQSQHSQRAAAQQPPYPQDNNWQPSPPSHQPALNRRSITSTFQSSPNPSLPSPPVPGSTPGPTPPAHGVPSRTSTLNRHPQHRPLPGPPEPDADRDYFSNSGVGRLSQEDVDAISQEDLFSQVENAVMNASRGIVTRRSQEPSERNGSHIATANGHPSHSSPAHAAIESDESDAEAAQGLAMMEEAEQEEARRRSGGQMRFAGLGSQLDSRPSNRTSQAVPADESDGEDYGLVDMSSFGGGYDVQMSYGGDPNQLAAIDTSAGESTSQHISSQQSSMRRSHASQSSRGERDYESIHPFRPFNAPARVDAGGTGGLSEPTGRRQSYDEGDEELLTDGQLPDRFPDEPPNISFNAASTSFSSGRPLPPPPADEGPRLHTDIGLSSSPYAPDAVTTYNAQGQLVPRSTSLVSHSHTPAILQPLRSKTDAEERRLRLQQPYRGSGLTTYESTPASSVLPDLPSLGAKRFVPSKLGAPDFKKCEEPWSLMSVLKWLLTVISPEQYTELKEAEVTEALVNLFTNKIPTMNIADAEGLALRVVEDMYHAGALVTTEEWVKMNPVPMSGVIYQLTGSGCYSGTLHDHIVPGRCYSHFCQRTLKKVNLQTHDRGSADWAQFYSLKKEDMEGRDKKEVERQNVLHEIIHTEDDYVEQLSILQTVYRDPLIRSDHSVITPKRKDNFIKEVFGRVDAVRTANLEHLLPQLKYRQQEQGPWIVGFSDIFRQWIRKAKAAYLEYAGGFPSAAATVRTEMDRSIDFRAFIDNASKDPRSRRLDWQTYLKAPITRLQRYTLLLSTVLKNMKVESEEKRNLQVALDEVKAVTHECDARVADMTRKVDLTTLSTKLRLRPGMQNAVELNLDHFGRELIHRGDLQRMGSTRFTWLDSHALLFDHYLVIAKTVTQTTEHGGKLEVYDVSRLPIPMDLLILESSNDPAVQKSSYVKGITSVATVSGRTATDASSLGRTPSNQSPTPGNLQHMNTAGSSASLQPVTSVDNTKDSDKIMYPFKVKHLGRDSYTLFAPTEQARRDWTIKITEAKTKHAASLFAQHAEPFRLRVMADSAFVFDAFAQAGRGAPVIKNTPIDRAVKEVEQRFKDTGRPGPICRARVNCATTFMMPYPGKQMVAVGTDFGVYVSETDNPRGWVKAVSMSRVTQVAVLEEFNLFLLISDRSLIAYHLDVVSPSEQNGPVGTNDSARKAPQKLSGSKDVGFFVTGRMKDRTLVFYKKRENLASVFKVLEPVYQKSTERRRGVFKRGTTEFFREFDEFYIPAESSGINLFHSSLAVSTARGFEVLTLDKKQPWSIPELRADHVQNIASHIKDQKALGMLRLSDQEFLLCYSNCAVYVNKHGDISRSVIMDFVGNAQSAALYGAYLILFDNDFVEIRNASNGRLKQIIAGREIKCLDDGGSWSSAMSNPPSAADKAVGAASQLQNGTVVNSTPGSRTVKFVMQHPESEKTQLVVELLLNEKMKE